MSDLKATVLHQVDDVEIHYSAPHPPRKSSPTYVRAHHRLIYVDLTPCWVCGLLPNHEGKFDDRALVNETHHDVIEHADFYGIDIDRVEADEPAWDWTKVDPHDPATFETALDGAAAMRVICSVHHRANRPKPDHRGILGLGIHHCSYPMWVLQRYQLEEYPLWVADDSAPFDPERHRHPDHAKHSKIAKARASKAAA